MNTAAMNILAADDDEFIVEMLGEYLKGLGHNVHAAKNGREALAVLEEHPDGIDIVIMDWNMPVMDGMTAVETMKKRPEWRHIPVIMITGSDKAEGIEQGLEAGVFYYLTKPVKETVLNAVISSAGKTAHSHRMLAGELKRHRAGFEMIDSCKFTFGTLEEAESLAVFMARCFPDSRRVLPGLGELLINAVEHGILSIGYEGKHRLVESGTWREEVERLQKLPEHAGKSATVTVSRKDDGVYIVVEDQGGGFEWKKYMTIDPARAGDYHGRGIAQAKAVSFDKLAYNEKGNKAVAFVKNGGRMEW